MVSEFLQLGLAFIKEAIEGMLKWHWMRCYCVIVPQMIYADL